MKCHLISLGCSCATRYQIDKYLEKRGSTRQATHFFDWVITSFITVLEIFETKDIRSYFKPEHIKKLDEPASNDHHIDVKVEGLNRFVSLHDIAHSLNAESKAEFIDKYIRRYWRLIDLIKKSTEPIYFFREEAKLSQALIDRFIKAVEAINPKANFKLIQVAANGKNLPDGPKFRCIDAKDYRPEAMKWGPWQKDYLDWNRVFNAALGC